MKKRKGKHLKPKTAKKPPFIGNVKATIETRRTTDGGTVEVCCAPGAQDRLKSFNLDALVHDVAGVAFDEDVPLCGVWERYDGFTTAEKIKELSRIFRMKNGGVGAGWERPTIQLDDCELRCRVSDIGPSVNDLVVMVENLKDGGEDSLTWFDEPGTYQWRFSRRRNLIYVESPVSDEGFYQYYEEFLDQLKSGA